MRARTFAGRLIIPAAITLFAGLGVLSYFFVSAEASKARILTEYEADHLASTLLDSYRAGYLDGTIRLDGRVLAFGIYRSSASPAFTYGNAPASLSAEDAQGAFRFDKEKGTLTLVRPLGMPGAPPRGMLPGFGPGPGMMMEDGPGPRMMRRLNEPDPDIHMRGGALYLSMNVSSFYRTQAIYGISAFAAPVLVAGLAIAFFLLLASNTRYRHRAEETETMARLGESARTLAHEIRNPLGAIRIQTALLRKKLHDSSFAELDAIEEETERLNALTRRVSDFLKDPKGTPEPIPLPAFFAEYPARAPFPVRVRAPAPACTFAFDRELFRSVMDNLVRNAWESYEGEPTERPIEIAASLEGSHLSVMVSDRGKGIPPGMEEKVFDPFFTDKVQGSGMGLSLCRRFARAAGGDLLLVARSGGGTEARILLEGEALS